MCNTKFTKNMLLKISSPMSVTCDTNEDFIIDNCLTEYDYLVGSLPTKDAPYKLLETFKFPIGSNILLLGYIVDEVSRQAFLIRLDDRYVYDANESVVCTIEIPENCCAKCKHALVGLGSQICNLTDENICAGGTCKDFKLMEVDHDRL